MYNFQYPDFKHTKWDDIVPGIDGAEGWYSDDLYPGKRVIFFLGAWGYRDALSCMSATMEEPYWDTTVKFHSGFLRLANRAWDVIFPYLNTTKPIIFAGHSMGGALASIIAYRYIISYGKVPGLELYATATLIGNHTYSERMKNYYKNLYIKGVGFDIVPRLWYLGLFVGYGKFWKLKMYPRKTDTKWYHRFIEDHQPWILLQVIPKEEDDESMG